MMGAGDFASTEDVKRDVAAGRISLAWLLLLLLIFSLAFQQPAIRVLGFAAVPSDFIYLALLAAWTFELVAGRARFVWQQSYWLLGCYFAAMLASAVAAGMPTRTSAKLLTQVYLLSLPVIAISLVQSERQLRQALLAWLAGAGVVALVGVSAVVAFLVDPQSPLFAFARSDFGTLPPGNYPRLWLTFRNPNMLCNYLTVSLVIILIARHRNWISRTPFLLLLGGILLSALFTISTGLGGVVLALGWWGWLRLRDTHRVAGRLALIAGMLAAVLFVLAAVASPVIPRDVPYLIHIPYIDRPFAPAVRLLTWSDAVHNLLGHPILGRGIGADSVFVRYWVPYGYHAALTDAHNMFLNISVQCGIVGLTALLALIVYVWRHTFRPHRIAGSMNPAVPVALGFAFLNAFAYQGLIGSFEDARHLWVLFGLFAASISYPFRNAARNVD